MAGMLLLRTWVVGLLVAVAVAKLQLTMLLVAEQLASAVSKPGVE